MDDNSNKFIDEINNKMASFWPEIYEKFKKIMSKRDVAILNLLSTGQSILFISDVQSRTKLYNLFSKFEIEYLICDFEDEINDENFLAYLIEDSDRDFDLHMTDLIKLKEDTEKSMDVLSKKYTNSNLFPFEIKENREYYLSKIGNDYIFPILNLNKYDEISIKNVAEDIISFNENYHEVMFLENYFSKEFFQSDEYNELIKVSQSFKKNMAEFIELNNKLNKFLGIKIFDDFDSVKYLENISVLSEDVAYINKNDVCDLNNCLKEYFKNNSIELEQILNSYEHYFNEVDDEKEFINNLENNIKYSELVDNEILSDLNYNSNLVFLINKTELLLDYSRYLKKQLVFISNFYSKYDCFELDSNKFIPYTKFDNLNNYFEEFLSDLNKVVNFEKYMDIEFDDPNTNFYAELSSSNKIDCNIEDVFYFNYYNQLWDNFLNEYSFIDESKLKPIDYKKDLKEINARIGSNESEKFLHAIAFHIGELNKKELVLEQKKELSFRIDNNDNSQIFDILKEFKEFVFANRRLFMIDEKNIPQLSSINYIQEFDYIITKTEIKDKL